MPAIRGSTKKLCLAAVLALLAALTAAPSAMAGDTLCVGALTGVHDDVVVPEGATCDISAAQIKGNVKALPGSILRITGGTTVGGSIEGDKPNNVQLFGVGNVVHGNIQVKEGGNGVQGVSVCGFTLPDGGILIEKINGGIFVGGPGCAAFGGGNNVGKGNIKVEDNFITPAFGLQVGQNQVAQNIQVFKNKGPGAKSVQGNTAAESIQCFDNDAPFVGGPNTAPKTEGQCS